MLYGLCDEWTARAQLLAALGGKHEALDEQLAGDEPAAAVDEPESEEAAAASRQARIAQVAALARAMK